MKPLFVTAFAIATLAAAPVRAQEVKVGDLVITQPWSRATPKGASVAGAWLTVRNTGATPDKLVGGSADFAGAVQVHEMSMDGGVMKMRELAKGLDIPAGATVELKPGGYHLMITGLKSPLTQGQTAKITLNFEHAGKAVVEFKVGGIGDKGPAGDSIGGMKM
jgi:copper(I)-binding protein